MLPRSDRSEAPVIVNVSIALGPLAVTTDPERLELTFILLAYPSSKDVLNMLTTQYAKALPRYGSTQSTRLQRHRPQCHRGTQTVEQGADVAVTMATIGPDGPPVPSPAGYPAQAAHS
jgi:hypothetical protein